MLKCPIAMKALFIYGIFMELSYKPKQQYAKGGNSVTQYKPNDYDTAKLGTLNIKMGYNTIPLEATKTLSP